VSKIKGKGPYFADPYAAYQRGTNEHFNGRLRRYLPKGTSFEDLTQDELDEFVREINNRPRQPQYVHLHTNAPEDAGIRRQTHLAPGGTIDNTFNPDTSKPINKLNLLVPLQI